MFMLWKYLGDCAAPRLAAQNWLQLLAYPLLWLIVLLGRLADWELRIVRA
jgi:hypothetical protein